MTIIEEIFGIFNKRNPEHNPQVPSEPVPAKKEKEPTMFYSLGNVEGNRVRFKIGIGYEYLTMNQDALKALIVQLSSFVTK